MESQIVTRRGQFSSFEDSWDDAIWLDSAEVKSEDNSDEDHDDLHLFHREFSRAADIFCTLSRVIFHSGSVRWLSGLVRFCNPRNSHGGFLDVANSIIFVCCVILTAISVVETIQDYCKLVHPSMTFD